MAFLPPRRRWFAPEVVQTSAMDCGPAALKCLLDGHGLGVSYGRLREACQTSLDGTSIDTIEDVAVQLGLDAEQVMLPVDHLLQPESLAAPSVVVICLPTGLTHFVVLWRLDGPLVQLMDPAVGRRWSSRRRLAEELYVHSMPVDASEWLQWATTREFLEPLRRRLDRLGIPSSPARGWVERCAAGTDWLPLAALDAGARMLASLVRSGGLRKGRAAGRLLEGIHERACAAENPGEVVPNRYWTAFPAEPSEEGEARVLMRGALLVRVRGRRRAQARKAPSADEMPAARTQPMSPEMAAALREPAPSPAKELLRLLAADGWLKPAALLTALTLAAGGVMLEALLFRGLIDVSRELGLMGQRLGAMAAVILFLSALALLELPIVSGLLRLGRRLETRFRIAFLEKVPRLHDRYFQSRLTSDMAERSHAAHRIRRVPELGALVTRSGFEVLFTAAGIIWLDPAAAPLACAAAVSAIALPLLAQPVLAERDLRQRSHAAALGRYYLDALLGLVPIRSHGAARAVQREHQDLLSEWAHSGLRLQRAVVATEGFQLAAGIGLAAWLVLDHLSRAGEAVSVLLLVYWALNLPVLGQTLAIAARQYPAYRNTLLRLLEPLGAPETAASGAGPPGGLDEALARGMDVCFENVSARAGGHTILEEISLRLEPGTHAAIVGPSGAGKSSLVGMLLGWLSPGSGRLLVDGQELDAAMLDRLRQQTAWVDPAVHLWNRSLLENVRYGSSELSTDSLAQALEGAELPGLLEKLPDGLQSRLGEGGALVSGGEGQRVRLARAMLRTAARLVILDEPFRGLDRERRRRLLGRARKLWRGATLLCVTHDVTETQEFDRVVVIENGRLAEQGNPADLLAKPDSRYRDLLEADQDVRKAAWSGDHWRKLRLETGGIREPEREPTP